MVDGLGWHTELEQHHQCSQRFQANLYECSVYFLHELSNKAILTGVQSFTRPLHPKFPKPPIVICLPWGEEPLCPSLPDDVNGCEFGMDTQSLIAEGLFSKTTSPTWVPRLCTFLLHCLNAVVPAALMLVKGTPKLD